MSAADATAVVDALWRDLRHRYRETAPTPPRTSPPSAPCTAGAGAAGRRCVTLGRGRLVGAARGANRRWRHIGAPTPSAEEREVSRLLWRRRGGGLVGRGRGGCSAAEAAEAAAATDADAEAAAAVAARARGLRSGRRSHLRSGCAGTARPQQAASARRRPPLGRSVELLTAPAARARTLQPGAAREAWGCSAKRRFGPSRPDAASAA